MEKEIQKTIERIKSRINLLIASIKTIKFKDVSSLCNEIDFYKQILFTLEDAKSEIERLKTK